LALRASRSQEVIRCTFPSRSPTVGFIWTIATRKSRIGTLAQFDQKKRPHAPPGLRTSLSLENSSYLFTATMGNAFVSQSANWRVSIALGPMTVNSYFHPAL